MTAIYEELQPFVPGSAYTFYTFLVSRVDNDVFQTTITLAAGDVTWSKDGGAAVNISSLPVETGTSGLLTVILSAAETTGVTKFGILKFHDVAGDEWQDVAFTLAAKALGTLSQTGSSAVAAMTGSDLAMVCGITYSTTLSGLTIPATWTKVYMTVKKDLEADTDAESILQIVESNPGVGTDGITYINRVAATPTTRAYGSLTVNQPAGTVAVLVTDEGTTLLPAESYTYDLKALLADGSTQQLSGNGKCVVSWTETRT